jgi:hypothetical protein
MTEPRFSDDLVQHRARKELLTKLAANTRDPGMAEAFTSWYSGLSDEEREAAAARGEEAQRELAAPPPAADSPAEDEDFSDRTWLRGPEG